MKEKTEPAAIVDAEAHFAVLSLGRIPVSLFSHIALGNTIISFALSAKSVRD